MNTEKRDVVIRGTINSFLSLSVCALGAWMLYLETTATFTYIIFGIPIRGKVLASTITYLGVIALFFSIRNTIRRFSQISSN
jgi:hypothetical protein